MRLLVVVYYILNHLIKLESSLLIARFKPIIGYHLIYCHHTRVFSRPVNMFPHCFGNISFGGFQQFTSLAIIHLDILWLVAVKSINYGLGMTNVFIYKNCPYSCSRLLFWTNFILNFSFDSLNVVSSLDFQGDGLSSKCLDEYLHYTFIMYVFFKFFRN